MIAAMPTASKKWQTLRGWQSNSDNQIGDGVTIVDVTVFFTYQLVSSLVSVPEKGIFFVFHRPAQKIYHITKASEIQMQII